MKKQINGLLRRFGYQLTRINRFEELLERRRSNQPEFTVVQIGANDGVRFDTLFGFITRTACSGLVVEPVGDYFELLERNYAAYPRITPVRVALHPTERTATMYRVDPAREHEVPGMWVGVASFDPEHHRRTGVPSEMIIEEEVPCVSLMELLDTHGIDHVDLLQIDVEGFDAEVVRMIDFARLRPMIIKFEHVSLSREDRADVTALLERQGYTLFTQGIDTVAHLPAVA